MNFIIAITIVACILSTVISSPDCPINNLWVAPPDYAGLKAKFQSESVDQLFHCINKDIAKECKQTNAESRTYNREGLVFMADRLAKSCDYNRQFNRQILAAIKANVTDKSKRHELIQAQAQWHYYWSDYFGKILYRQQDCSMKQLGYSEDLGELQKQFVDKRNQILATLANWVDQDKQNNDWQIWQSFNEKALDDNKVDYENVDKIVANLTPEAIKVKTMQNLVYEVDIYSRVKTLQYLVYETDIFVHEPDCPVKNLWEAPPNYAELKSKFQNKSEAQLIQSINQEISKQCKLTNDKSRIYKKEGLVFMAERWAQSCDYERQFNDGVLDGIKENVTQSKQYEQIKAQAQWHSYWSEYLGKTLSRQQQCSMKQLGYSENVQKLQKQLQNKRNIVLVALKKWIDMDNKNDNWTLNDQKEDSEETDSIVSDLTPNKIKVKTLQNLVYEADIYSRGIKNIKF
ncbi:uncharacterized protein LOC128953411 [Oppia nitens]|uniref:uncharacterized protein LOC128953411 n=1 Tax=Oppia nitens TaxID=1686743 RepID=UPI0023DA6D6E|nr:uncharacterized protein LOC128953411 [Oppia nitens]